MNFYRITPGVINDEVGSIASLNMSPGYNYDNYNSVCKLKTFGKMGFTPDFKSIDILLRAKPLDIIECLPIIAPGLIISDKLMSLFELTRLPVELEIFDVTALYRGFEYHYNYFYLYETWHEDYINYEKTQFFKADSDGRIIQEININCVEEFYSQFELNSFARYIPGEIHLKTNLIEYDLFRLDFIGEGYYVSDKLKDYLQSMDCQGIDFTESSKIRQIF